jgi:hypothetical protein
VKSNKFVCINVTAIPSPPLARLAISRHMWVMTGRPCNPNGDLKQLWQVLLPGTAFPQCGNAEKSHATVRSAIAPTPPPPNGGKPRLDEPPHDS